MAGRQDLFQQAMNQGHSAAWEQLWEKAAGFYQQALAEFPDHPQALTSLGLAWIELQDYKAALQCYEKAAKVAPSDPLPLEKVAQLYERFGNLDRAVLASFRAADLYLKLPDATKAVENLNRVMRLDPLNLPAHTRLALIYERTQERRLAVQQYLEMASLFQSSGSLDKAEMAVRQALRLQPDNQEALQALALLKDFKPLPKPERPRGETEALRLAQIRHMQAGQEPDQHPILVDPVEQACQTALTALANMLFEVPVEEDSAERRGLQAIVSGSSTPQKPVDLARIALHLSQVVDLQTRKEYKQATDELQRAMDAGLEHPAAYYDLGYLAAKSGRSETALRLLQHAVRDNDYALGARLLLGEMLISRGQMREAATNFMEALKLADAQLVAPEHSNELRQLYDPLIESLKQRDAQALSQLCQNIQGILMQADWQARLAQARAQVLNQVPEMIRPVAEILTEAQSGPLIEAIFRIQQYRSKGQLRLAMDEAFSALDMAPNYLPLHTLMGEILVAQGDIPGAVSKFSVVAKAYSVRGETQQAIAMYRSILELDPTDFHIRNRLIEQMLASGQMENAVKETMRLAEVSYRQADLGTARKIYSDALRIAQQAAVDRSLRVKILHRMGDIDLQSLDWRQGLRIFEQIRTLQPEDEKARFRLVELNLRLNQETQALGELDQYVSYLISQQQEKMAVKFLENLVAEDPTRVPIRRRLADLYRRAGSNEQVIEQWDAIGDLLLEAGDRAGASQAIETILALKPANMQDYIVLLEQIRNNQV